MPDSVWAQHELTAIASPKPTWCAVPAGRGSIEYGDEWNRSLRSPILLVPSVIVPEEFAALINPSHPEVKKITAKVIRPFEQTPALSPS